MGVQARGRPTGRLGTAGRLLAAAFAAVVVGSLGGPGLAVAGERVSGEPVAVIIRQTGPGTQAQAAVQRLGGTVGQRLGILTGFRAVLPADRLDDLGPADGVASVTRDGSLRLLGDEWLPDKDLGSFYSVTKSINAHDVWSQSDSSGAKYTGKGIGVAVIDCGVAPVEGLNAAGKVINGPDLSLESQAPHLRHLDTFGHGTHMDGIIAGRDAAVKDGNENDSKNFVGVAPDANIINIKVASADGAVDVSQVIAAIDWVVQHRDDPGLNIRVLNLSFGTDSVQSYELDPLAYAVEVAWRRGIVVVVAAGNEGADGSPLTMPAADPYVLAVGASDHNGTEDGFDDKIADFSSVGSNDRRPDLVAPGRSIVSLRTPGSYLDQAYPGARVTHLSQQRFFRGSGTSQAAAVVSGAAALVLDQRPSLTPDQVKYVLTHNARKVPGTVPAQGAGVLNLKDVHKVAAPAGYRQNHKLATGLGSLELSRGGSHVADPETGVELVGEQDIFGDVWDGRTWSQAAWEGRTWSGGDWQGRTWSGDSWSGESWAGRTWSSVTWTGRTWSGRTWSGRTWSANTWNGRTWSGDTWSGRTWSGRTWSGRTWSGDAWF